MPVSASNQPFTLVVLMISLLTTVVLTTVFLAMPEIDLIVQRWFFSADTTPGRGFVLMQYPTASILRKLVMIAYGIWYVIVILGLIAAINKRTWVLSPYLKFDFKQWLFLTITSLLGPLLLSNIILKDNWGRARPRQLLEFGGDLQFTPPVLLSDQCQANCSFVSGEASSMFMIFIALALAVPAKRHLFVFLTIVLGSLSGLMRMAFGGHFLSDVIFAGLFMCICASVVYWIMFHTKLMSKIPVNDSKVNT